jgi:hypothetical protein
MNIEQKMAYIRRALELGASIDVKWYTIESEEKARELIADLEKDTVPFKQKESEKTNWFAAYDYENAINTTIFFDKEYLEEDVDLSGMEEGEEIA